MFFTRSLFIAESLALAAVSDSYSWKPLSFICMRFEISSVKSDLFVMRSSI